MSLVILMRSKAWTAEELNYIREVWGEKTVPEIAAKLGRTINAVKIKAVRQGYRGQKWSGEMMSARKVSELLGVDIHTVTDWWISKCGLKAKAKRLGESKRTTTIIMFEDLLYFLRTHQELWDSRRIEEYALGAEYAWLKEKRNKDRELPIRRLQKWTRYEDGQLIIMYKRGLAKSEIAKRLGRSYASVERRISRLDVWGSGKHISDEERKRKKREKQEGFEKKALCQRLVNCLLAYRNSQEYGEFWQKDMCRNWDKVRGCSVGNKNCDECGAFSRILPQYCARCGITFFEREEQRFCKKCREQRKKNGFKKYLRTAKENL